MSSSLSVVVQSSLLLPAVGRNGEATFSKGSTIRSLPIVWNFADTSLQVTYQEVALGHGFLIITLFFAALKVKVYVQLWV